MMQTELSINGQDYSWLGADLYTKSSTQPVWKRIKTYESDIVNVTTVPGKNRLQIVTKDVTFQTDLNGTALKKY